MINFLVEMTNMLMCVPIEYWTTIMDCHTVVKHVSDD